METRIPEIILDYFKNMPYTVEATKNERVATAKGKPFPEKGSKVIATNIPELLLEDYLLPYFERAGHIYKFCLMLSSPMVNSGTAYITYSTNQAAQAALELFDGRILFINDVISVKKAPENTKLFFGGIPETCTKKEIWDELVRTGMVGIIDVIVYPLHDIPNKHRGFAFVEFRSHEEAACAKESYRNFVLFGQRIVVDWASIDSNNGAQKKMKILFLRNVDPSMSYDDFIKLMRKVLEDLHSVTKIYKFNDYAFIHFQRRKAAQKAICLIRAYNRKNRKQFQVEWAKPPTDPEIANSNKENIGEASNKSRLYVLPTCTCKCKHSKGKVATEQTINIPFENLTLNEWPNRPSEKAIKSSLTQQPDSLLSVQRRPFNQVQMPAFNRSIGNDSLDSSLNSTQSFSTTESTWPLSPNTALSANSSWDTLWNPFSPTSNYPVEAYNYLQDCFNIP